MINLLIRGFRNQMPLPLDALAASGFTVAAAHSVSRKLRLGYAGNAFQIASAVNGGGNTLDIGFKPDFPYEVDLSGVAQFVSDNSNLTYWSKIYDQSGNGNNLPMLNDGSLGRQFIGGPIDSRTVLPSGKTVCVVDGNCSFTTQRPAPPNNTDPPAQVTQNMPTGNDAVTIFGVYGTAFISDPLYGGYGMVENDIADNGDNTMHMLAYTVSVDYNETGVGPGDGHPRLGADLENGTWGYGPDYESSYDRVTGISKWDGVSDWTVRGAGITETSFTTLRSGALPDSRTEFFLESEGAIALGKGGDNSGGLIHFYEGIIVAGATNTTADQLVLNSIYEFYN